MCQESCMHECLPNNVEGNYNLAANAPEPWEANPVIDGRDIFLEEATRVSPEHMAADTAVKEIPSISASLRAIRI
jgi:hypothetical protein